MKNSRFRHIYNHAGLAVFTAMLFGGIGTYFVHSSFAASYQSDPTAIADYCQIENNHTVLYGWGYDPESDAGDQPYVTIRVGSTAWTVATNNASYRTAQVNSWIDTYYPGAPKMGTYGWRLEITGYYKGGAYPVSGTVTNIGAGTNAVLQVNSGFDFSGEPTGSKPLYTTDKKLPDACLVAAPAPAPAPTPTPAKPKTTAPKAATPSPAPAAAPAVSNAADATVTAGSGTATLSVPAGNAGTVYIRYGTDANNLNHSSDIQTLSGATATIQLDKLNGKTTYTYQIVRTQGTQTTTSANATFTTKGYTLVLKFTDASGKPVDGISAQLGSGKAVKSDDDGTVTFKNLGTGSYSPIFTYNGQSYSENFSTSSDGKESDDGTIVLSKTIDLSKLHKNSAQAVTKNQSESGSSKISVLILVLLLALVGGGIWWAIRRKRRLLAEAYGYAPTDYVPPVIVDNPAPVPQTNPEPKAVVEAVARHGKTKKHHEPTTPAPAHIGESLRDMVIQSMAEDAARRPNDRPKPPIVPGG